MEDIKKSIYQALYKLTEIILNHYNPCHHNGNGCLGGNPVPCCNFRDIDSKWGVTDPNTSKCQFLGGEGCSNPDLECKVWLCRTAIEKIDRVCLESLKAIEMIGIQFDFIHHPYLGEPYVGMDKF